ncbi:MULTISPECIES: DUF817 domain-containing protein [unclassified Ensifer]|uniref:DUF817 domain-containing protein n=1 Tax=unclassified Ensifer TaxID=2633371 RepID=UPI000812F4BC|nr:MULTISPECIES: DUF817 domain-containing protein [unclassified Ensifer]OCP05786.1 hypothetical protein BBX50_04680 [Ensifer sp. LC11]OCP06531.1 hypothetical protein BC374_04745 [Ensifer sp. LC13]OCP06743.1 hypothetical protein BC362_11420 [Ensifer sp. LC14]OCP31230.1 hypothetical protein BC364_05350 [Ensifer sp. LC499]
MVRVSDEKRFTSREARIDAAAHRLLDRLPAGGLLGGLTEFLVFGIKQAFACLFGGAMLGLMLVTRLWWPEDIGLARYDFLFLSAIAIQISLLVFKLETAAEAKVILIFHVVGTLMEIFKTAAGSWVYPEPSLFRIGGVPLFSGFMYAAVGSYLARVTRILDMRYTGYPPLWATLLLALAIYVNFFSHHFIIDLRYLLFALTAVLFLRTTVHYRVFRFRHRMPLLIGFLLVALFIWFAENIGTWSRAWIYPSQHNGWAPVSLQKLGAWYLLMILSFVLVTLVHRPRCLLAGTRGSQTLTPGILTTSPEADGRTIAG